jgi:DNA-binding MarR family transcriptional regulator
LRRAYHIAKANTGAGLRDLGMTPMQAAAVMAVHRAGTLSQADLGRAIGMQPANVHGIVDARHVLVSLAPAGRDQAAHVAALSAAAHDATLAPLDAHERDTLIALLSRIAL